MKRFACRVTCVLSALSGFACGNLDGQVCITRSNVAIPAAPQQASGTLDKSFDFDTSSTPLAALKGISSTFTLDSVTFKADQGIQDFSFIQSASMSITDPSNSALPPISSALENQPATASLSLSLQHAENITQYLKDSPLHMDASFTGTFPTHDWSVDLTMCVTLDAQASALGSP